MQDQRNDLLEREDERAVLESVFAAAALGMGGAVAIEGEAGAGKTSLLRAARGMAPACGLRVLWARGAELERSFAFGVARQLAAALFDASDEDPLKGPWRTVARLLSQEASETLDSRSLGFALSAVVADTAAEAPVAILVDDAHWADEESLAWLAQLARDAGDQRLALVVAMRIGEPGAEASLRELRSAPEVRRLPVKLLTPPSVAHLVRRRCPNADDDFCNACATATGGNPFLTLALLDALAVDGLGANAAGAARVAEIVPAAVTAGTMLRVSRLGPDAAALAHAVAVLERDVRLADAAALAEISLSAAAEAADQLRSAGVLIGARELSFVHPLLRAAVYEDLPPATRRERHRAAARTLAHRGDSVERVATHLLRTHPAGDADVVATLQSAAAEAMRRGVPAVAVTLLERAVEEPPNPQQRHSIEVALAQAQHAAGSDPTAVMPRVVAAVRSAPTPEDAARAATALMMIGVRSGRPHEAVSLMEEVMSALPDDVGDLRVELEEALLAVSQNDALYFSRFMPRVVELRATIRGETPAERALLVELALWTALAGGTREEVKALLQRAGQLRGANRFSSALALAAVEELDEARELLAGVTRDARRDGDIPTLLNGLCYGAVVALQGGDLRIAEVDAAEAARLAGGAPTRGPLDSFLARILIARGKQSDAAALAATVDLRHLPETTVQRLVGELLLAAVDIPLGHPQRAVERARMVGHHYEPAGLNSTWLGDWRSTLSAALSALGNYGEARALALDEAEIAAGVGAPGAQGAALLAAALASERPDPAELETVVEQLRHSPAKHHLSRALVELGASLRRGGERRTAREPLREGLDLAVRCGADSLATRARQELQATGAQPRRDVRSGVAALTPSEIRVARMAAEGMSNREIAQALYVARKTVETHMGNVLLKLGVSSRRDIPDALDLEDLSPIG